MDKHPESKHDVEYVEAEYVDAEPMGPEPAPAARPAPEVHTYYHSGGGCVPCCGPVGCASVVLVALLLFGDADLARPLLFALGIFMIVSLLAGILAPRRR